jgi:alkanesulfonate monooxygenase SsuD/methylene tetrahydromethanopterin reductase-like flavin-dependent oxidoreductase (luciferase family)
VRTCFFSTTPYAGTTPAGLGLGGGTWPVPPEQCDRQASVETLRRSLETIVHAEELGFDWVSLSEHHYAPGLVTPNPAILAAAVARATRRVKIALLGPLLPLANPVRTAEEVAMLDALSDGRMIVLFLRGTPNEHLTYRTNPDETRAMTQEGIELILRAWTEPQPFGWEGRFYRFRTVSVWPRTPQDPHPIVFGSGNSPDSIAFAARKRLGLAIAFAPPPVVRRSVETYRRLCEKEGWEPRPDHVLYRCLIRIEDTADRARRPRELAPDIPVGPTPDERPGAPTRSIADMRPQLSGGPDEVIEQAHALRECGVGVLDLAFPFAGLATERLRAAMSLYAAKAMPQIQGL